MNNYHKLTLHRAVILMVLLFVSTFSFAQHKVKLSKSFSFQDGVYTNLTALQTNSPSHEFNEFDIEAHPLNQFDSKRYELKFRNSGRYLRNKDVLAIVEDGDLMINYEYASSGYFTNNAIDFNRLNIIGHLCYYIFREAVTNINPQTGVMQTHYVNREILFNFKTGESVDFTHRSLLNFIKDDKPLYETLLDLDKKEAKTKIYKCIKIYNDRNPFYLEIQ